MCSEKLLKTSLNCVGGKEKGRGGEKAKTEFQSNESKRKKRDDDGRLNDAVVQVD